MEIIGQGAEAEIYKEDETVIKIRPKKGYRIEILDKKIRKKRTKREVKIINKLIETEVLVPKIHSSDDFTIKMDYLNGKKVRDCYNENIEIISKRIGKSIAIMHNNNIIHGDLTTSNMIFFEENVYFIDFGLSQISVRIEDKAVDIHLLKQALISYHYKIHQKAYQLILEEYQKNCNKSTEILERLKIAEKRGRNKH